MYNSSITWSSSTTPRDLSVLAHFFELWSRLFSTELLASNMVGYINIQNSDFKAVLMGSGATPPTLDRPRAIQQTSCLIAEVLLGQAALANFECFRSVTNGFLGVYYPIPEPAASILFLIGDYR